MKAQWWIMTTISSICWYALLEIALCTCTEPLSGHAHRPGNLYFQPIVVISSQIPQDSLDTEQGETRAQHAHQPGQILHLIPILAPSLASLDPSAHPMAVSIPPAHIQAPLPTLNGEVLLCLANIVGSGYGVDPASSAELPSVEW